MIDNTSILALTDIIQLPEAERLQAIKDKFSAKSHDELLNLLGNVLNVAVNYAQSCDETLYLHMVTNGGMHPYSIEKLISPSFHGALNGLILAQKAPNQDVLCESCAYRCGTLANHCLSTQSDLAHALESDAVFYCHKDIENLHSPSVADRKRMKPCKGWAQHVKKKRTKKFNPNKLLPSQVKQLQQAAQYKKDISETYEMSMEFISSHVRDFIEDKKIGEKSLLDKFPHAETLPYHFTIGAYHYQDLSIALILGHVEQPEAWKLSADIHMMNLDDLSKPMVTVEFRRDLPSMSHIELLRGKKDCKIDLGHGLKKVGWLGLDQEIIKEIESQKNIPDDFGIEQIQVLIEADIKFINTKCYQEFLAVAEWVNAGHELAEDRLRKLWIADQVLGGSGKTIGYEGAA